MSHPNLFVHMAENEDAKKRRKSGCLHTPSMPGVVATGLTTDWSTGEGMQIDHVLTRGRHTRFDPELYSHRTPAFIDPSMPQRSRDCDGRCVVVSRGIQVSNHKEEGTDVFRWYDLAGLSRGSWADTVS